METIIKVSPSELDENLLEKIKKFIGKKNNVDVTISLREFDPEYADALDRSVEQGERGEGLTYFTMEDFMSYNPSQKKR